MSSTLSQNRYSGHAERTACTAFEGSRRIASGDLLEVVRRTKPVFDTGGPASILIFDDNTSELIEVDFRGSTDQVLQRLARPSWDQVDAGTTDAPEKRGPGRPKLGVVAREVTLLPRHWEWLDSQSGGASVALRKLVEQAKRSSHGQDRLRQSQEAVYRFMCAMAGDLPGFEEALRAFYARNGEQFNARIEAWPGDIRDHVRKLAAVSFEAGESIGARA